MIASALTQVRLLYQQQNFDDALAVLERYAAHNDLTVEMFLLKRRLIQLSETGKWDLSEAKRCFLQALEQDTENINVMLEMGWLLLNVFDEPAEAGPYFQQALAVIEAAQKEARAGLDDCEK